MGSRSLSLVALALLAACARGPIVATPKDLDPAALYARVLAVHSKPDTLTAVAKAFVDAAVNGGKYSLNLSVKRPDSLRIEALTPLGDPAALMVTKDGRFALFDIRRGEFYRGPATPKNLSKLFPVPLRDDELVSIFLGSVPELRGGAATAAGREGDRFHITLETATERQELLVHQDDLRVLQVARGPAGGKPAWTVVLEEHDDGLPRIVKLSVPAEKIFLDLRLRDLLVGKPPPFGAFGIQPPKGVTVVDLE